MPPAYTSTTIGDARTLRAELRRVRALGYGFDQGEFHEGVSGIAGAVTDAGGGLAATVSVTAPTSRLTARLRRQVARSVVETARAISTELGAPPQR